MSTIAVMKNAWAFNRGRTLALLDSIAEHDQSAAILGWRPGPGRAHIAWQIMHVAITEELFATERLKNTAADYADIIPRFKGGSTPDDDIPSLDLIREVLEHSRNHLLQTIDTFTDADLGTQPSELLKQRGWTVETVLNVLAWHEGHHQGQAHLTLNLWKSQHGG